MKRYILEPPHFPVDVSSHKKSALIVGAGAVENAWNPIFKAFEPFVDFQITADGVNSIMARLVYLLRFFANSPRDEYKDTVDKQLEVCRKIKDSMITQLRIAERRGQIRARPILERILKELILPYGPSLLLITTNWDSVIPKAIAKILKPNYRDHLELLHIHGDISKLSTMYLPSEVTNEPYRKAKDKGKLGSLHESAISSLQDVGRVVVYGLSIDPLDAELGQTLSFGWRNPNLEEIFVINPNHKVVAHRINLLLLDTRRDIRVIGFNPDTLKQEADYTIWRHRKLS